MKKAAYWQKLSESRVQCTLCPHRCVILPGNCGICRVRGNVEGTLFSIGYGNTTSIAIDPIEKKPLFHFKPGTNVLSVSPNGCNFSCKWCQNWQISQDEVFTRYIDPDLLVTFAIRERAVGIAFTYTEPLIWFEYIIDVARIAKTKNIAIVLVTNGYIESAPLNELLPYVDAMNIDLKSLNADVYRKFIGGTLEPVKATIVSAAAQTHVELTTLIVPTINDTEAEIEAITDFVASINEKIPLHISRYFPSFRLDLPPTSPQVLERSFSLAKRKLPFVYVGNYAHPPGENTFCPRCGALLIERRHYDVKLCGISPSCVCNKCGNKIDIVL